MSKIENSNINKEKLTENEKNYMTVGPAITTVTFMRGNSNDANIIIKQRYIDILKANPWLTGTLHKNANKDVEIHFSNASDFKNYDLYFNPINLKGESKKNNINSTMEFFDLCNTIGNTSAEIKKGSDCIDTNLPLIALTIIPDSIRPDDTFAIVFSVSHAIIDGYTYYRLLSMLSSDGTIVPLNAKRKHHIVNQSKTAMGEKESEYAYAGSTVCNIICSMIYGKKPLIESYYIDKNKIDKLKSVNKNGVEFVSTNDIITSSFAIATSARTLLMPLNFRERLPDFKSDDAGNYEGALVFGPEDYATPQLIRKTLNSGPPSYKRNTDNKLPSGYEGMSCRISMVTNWTFSFYSELKINNCQQMLHLPHCDVNLVPFDIAVIYRPKAGEIAITYFVRNMGKSEDIQKNSPVGDKITCAEKVFEM